MAEALAVVLVPRIQRNDAWTPDHDRIYNATTRTLRPIPGETMALIIRFIILAGLYAGWFSNAAPAHTSTVIPDTEAAEHIGQDATVEGVVGTPPDVERPQ
jgi:hypothetical protein